MPAPHPLVVHAFYGYPRLGIWCPKCLLPSGYQVDVFKVSLSGVAPWGFYRACFDCDIEVYVSEEERNV